MIYVKLPKYEDQSECVARAASEKFIAIKRENSAFRVCNLVTFDKILQRDLGKRFL